MRLLIPPFDLVALTLVAAWLLAVAIWFRRSTAVLIGGLLLVGASVFAAVLTGQTSLASLGLGLDGLRAWKLGLAVVWVGVMYAYSPVADLVASRLVRRPPTPDAFKRLQRSHLQLLLGVLFAWVAGAGLEELTFRGLVLPSVQALAAGALPPLPAAAAGVAAAALGAGVGHLYQGGRAAIIITHLSALFGVLFVLTGGSLWAVMLCHGVYDTIAFIRFAQGKSKYSRPDPEQPSPGLSPG